MIYPWYSFLLDLESTPGPLARPEGLRQRKIPMTPSGIEPTQCLKPTVSPRTPRTNYDSRPTRKDAVSINGDIILSDESHHFSPTSFGATLSRQFSARSSSNVPLAGVHVLRFNVLQIIFGSVSPYLKNALQIDKFDSLRYTSQLTNTLVVAC